MEYEEVGNSRFRAPRQGEHFPPALPTGAWGFSSREVSDALA